MFILSKSFLVRSSFNRERASVVNLYRASCRPDFGQKFHVDSGTMTMSPGRSSTSLKDFLRRVFMRVFRFRLVSPAGLRAWISHGADYRIFG